MAHWTLAGLVVLALLVGTLWVLFRDDAIPRPAVERPDWLVPRPQQIREARFSLVWQGYDPEEVDALLDQVAVAYEELLLAAGPSGMSRAESRVAERLVRTEGA
ncbi:MAG: DivIVA domain-containing protein, partial [Nitriliruptorales bacterium]|nr:DivIVA domain-containing protein [Nitriliruptorales bacterium]